MLSADRETVWREHNEAAAPMAAAAQVFQGGIVCLNATGYAVAGSDTAGLIKAGVATEPKDNSDGADGDLSVVVRRGREFELKNSGITQADVGQKAYIADDETATNAAGATNDVELGIITEVESDGVWVYID